eukprot:2607588-Prymnesium_polylepis.1
MMQTCTHTAARGHVPAMGHRAFPQPFRREVHGRVWRRACLRRGGAAAGRGPVDAAGFMAGFDPAVDRRRV